MSEPMQAFPRGPDYPGMSLRDYFAAHAPMWAREHYAYPRDEVGSITWAWRYADAMLAERAQ